MKKKKKVKARITKGEKKLYSLAICAFVFTMVLKTFSCRYRKGEDGGCAEGLQRF